MHDKRRETGKVHWDHWAILSAASDAASGGNGLNYTFAGSDDAVHAIKRALYVYMDEELMKNLRNSTMNLDFSWEKSAEKYITLYNKN